MLHNNNLAWDSPLQLPGLSRSVTTREPQLTVDMLTTAYYVVVCIISCEFLCRLGLNYHQKHGQKLKIWHFLLLKPLKSLLGTGCCRSRVCVHSLWLCFPSCAYLWDLCCLILLQLLLEAIVWADKGANSFDRRQTLVPAVVGDGHEVSHHHGCTAGHTCKATAKKEHGWSLS